MPCGLPAESNALGGGRRSLQISRSLMVTVIIPLICVYPADEPRLSTGIIAAKAETQRLEA
jgi:hypothetical protein